VGSSLSPAPAPPALPCPRGDADTAPGTGSIQCPLVRREEGDVGEPGVEEKGEEAEGAGSRSACRGGAGTVPASVLPWPASVLLLVGVVLLVVLPGCTAAKACAAVPNARAALAAAAAGARGEGVGLM
jgi:hypothetical protein